jgi:predicted oxidoreductase
MSSSTPPQIPSAESEFIDIPATQLLVSRVALGMWAMGGWMWGGTDQRESVATIRAALHQGINLIDTPPVYGFGTSEEIVGAALEGVRGQPVIATKVGLEWRDGKVYRNASRARILQEVDDSLRRLRTDYIDIYQVHWPTAPGSLTPADYAAVMAFLLSYDCVQPRGDGQAFPPADLPALKQITPGAGTCAPAHGGRAQTSTIASAPTPGRR